MRISLRLACVLIVLCLLTISAQAATYTVTNTQDSGAGSFRQAVSDANGNQGDDTININIPIAGNNCNGGQCVINLSSGEIVLNGVGTTTVNNPTGAGKLEIRGNQVQRILFIDGGARLVINGVTLSNGGGRGSFQPPLDGLGGAIYMASGELELNNSIVSESLVPMNVAAANIRGGGIYIGASGRAVLNQTLVTRNKSAAGAGIFNQGILTLNNSTVSHNEGSTNPANGVTSSTGGGILSQGGATQTFITNSTVSDNSSTLVGGIETRDSAPFVLTNATIAFNAANGSANGVGGITTSLLGSPLIKMRNTIVSDNVASGSGAQPNMFGKYSSGGRNLLGVVDLTVVNGFTSNDFINSSSVFLNSLASNGGLTPTIVPQANSAAVNAGDNCVRTQLCPDFNAPIALFTDQRGVSRFSSGQVDIGAAERQFVNIANAANLPNGRQGQSYAETLFASGGTEPYTFTLAGGALPGGLTLSAGGFLSGTPTAAGVFNFTVQVTDSSQGSGFAQTDAFLDFLAPQAITGTKDFQLQILAQPTAALVTVGGRVSTAKGRGVFAAVVVMTDSSGNSRSVRTNHLGFYRFQEVAAGETYVFSVGAKRYIFNQPTQIRLVTEETNDITFVADN